MSTAAQITANIVNSQASTGPRTEEGKATSSKNSVVFGIYSGDFVRPGEESAHTALEAALLQKLTPVGVLEEVPVEEIHRATWRLRRCAEVESRLILRLSETEGFILDPMEALNQAVEKIQHSVDRARSQAHRLLHKSITELSKLQAQRQENETQKPVLIASPAADAKRTQFEREGTPRNSQCPCGSGQKYKRCYGRSAPAVLQAA